MKNLLSFIQMVIASALMLAALSGWVMNVVALVDCDFEAPFRAEIIRGVGVLAPPVGMIAGWVDIGR